MARCWELYIKDAQGPLYQATRGRFGVSEPTPLREEPQPITNRSFAAFVPLSQMPNVTHVPMFGVAVQYGRRIGEKRLAEIPSDEYCQGAGRVWAHGAL